MRLAFQVLAIVLVSAWMASHVVNYLDWRIRERRIWRNVKLRIDTEERHRS